MFGASRSRISAWSHYGAADVLLLVHYDGELPALTEANLIKVASLKTQPLKSDWIWSGSVSYTNMLLCCYFFSVAEAVIVSVSNSRKPSNFAVLLLAQPSLFLCIALPLKCSNVCYFFLYSNSLCIGFVVQTRCGIFQNQEEGGFQL